MHACMHARTHARNQYHVASVMWPVSKASALQFPLSVTMLTFAIKAGSFWQLKKSALVRPQTPAILNRTSLSLQSSRSPALHTAPITSHEEPITKWMLPLNPETLGQQCRTQIARHPHLQHAHCSGSLSGSAFWGPAGRTRVKVGAPWGRRVAD